MRRSGLWMAAWAACAGATMGCSKKGELVLAFETDMAIPRDVDALTIEVFKNNSSQFSREYPDLGKATAEIGFPATLTVIASDTPDDVVRIQATARAKGSVRVLREVVTTVPEDRSALLRIPLGFLCDDSGRDDVTGVVNTVCGEGETCVAGACMPSTIDSGDLPDYAAGDVFGGGTGPDDGTCVDVTTCFAEASEVQVDAGCSFPSGKEFNVALHVKNAGIVVDTGSFDGLVVLDADSAEGWTWTGDGGGTIHLTPEVCRQIEGGKVLGVVTTPVGPACLGKTESRPACAR